MTFYRKYKSVGMLNNEYTSGKIHSVENLVYQRLGSDPSTVTGKESD